MRPKTRSEAIDGHPTRTWIIIYESRRAHKPTRSWLCVISGAFVYGKLINFLHHH